MGARSSCVFCDIISKEPEKIVYKDDLFVVIRDIYPKAPNHLLVLSKQHIRNLNDVGPRSSTYEPLSPQEFLAKMKTAGEAALESELKHSIDKNLLQIGFHRPPFNSVLHLHLHVLYPTDSSMSSFWARFVMNGPWFAPIDYVLNNWKF